MRYFAALKRQASQPPEVIEAVNEKQPLPERPRPQLVQADDFPLEEYQQVAESLNFVPRELLQQRLDRFLAANNIPIYDYGQVNAYITALSKSKGKTWQWRSLDQYRHAIPLPILKQAALIKKEFPQGVICVTEIVEPRPDPFISVFLGELNKFTVFGVWDEPAFFEEK